MSQSNNLPVVTDLAAETDELFTSQSGVMKRLPLEVHAGYVASKKWKPLTAFTATPASATQITMSDVTGLEAGLPVRYTISNTMYYGVITEVVASPSKYIEVAGEPLAGIIADLAVGTPEMIMVEEIDVPGAYAASARDVMALVAGRYKRWLGGSATLVRVGATQSIEDSGTEPTIALKIAGTAVATIQLAGAGTWRYASAQSPIYWQSAFEIACTVPGGNGTAANLSVEAVFVIG